MLGRIQRRPGPDAPASEPLRWCRDVLLAFAGFGLVLGLPGLIAGSGGKLLAVAAGACVLFAAQFWALAAYFERRKPTARVRQATMTAAEAERQRLVSDWMFSVCMLPLPVAAAVVIDGVSALVPMASILGSATAAGRVVIYRYWAPESITMRQRDCAQLTGLMKLAAIVLGVGVLASIAIAIAGGPASVGLWPALALGVLCGIVSLVQLARATARTTHDRPI